MEFMQWLFGLVVLIFAIMAIVEILRSSTSVGVKLLWIALIIFLPVVGLIIYALVGRKQLAHV